MSTHETDLYASSNAIRKERALIRSRLRRTNTIRTQRINSPPMKLQLDDIADQLERELKILDDTIRKVARDKRRTNGRDKRRPPQRRTLHPN